VCALDARLADANVGYDVLDARRDSNGLAGAQDFFEALVNHPHVAIDAPRSAGACVCVSKRFLRFQHNGSHECLLEQPLEE
jgi:hypothetical protein